jgi:hypothetical protein
MAKQSVPSSVVVVWWRIKRHVVLKPSLQIRNHFSMLPPTTGLFESVSKYLSGPASDENNIHTQDAREMMDELLDPTVAAGEMNSSHLENAKREISLLVDMGQRTKQDIDKAWNLLDGLIEELKHPSKVALLPKEQTSLLNGILTVWRQSVATRFYIRVEKRDAIEESKHVLSKLDRDGPFFQLNTGSYNEVIHALNRFAKYIAGTKRTRAAIRLRVSQLAETMKRMNKKSRKESFCQTRHAYVYQSNLYLHMGQITGCIRESRSYT